MVTQGLSDGFGRRFPYLRLSVTDVCNFKCAYCLPHGYKKADGPSFLTRQELTRLVRAFVGLGVWKVRLTGGEPTLREDFLELVQDIRGIEGIKNIAFTTNGYRLPQRAAEYYAAGLRAINISIDSLQRENFHSITGHDRLLEVTDGVEASLEAGFESVKINTVLLKGMNDQELGDFIEFVKTRPISLRFIELMQTRDNKSFFDAHHLSGETLVRFLQEQGWVVALPKEGAGPAVEFVHPNSMGKIGLIAPYSKDFCKTCNRLRVSSRGDLHLCLFGEGGISLRDYLQEDRQIDLLQERIFSLLSYKRSTHFLAQGDSGSTSHLAAIGG